MSTRRRAALRRGLTLIELLIAMLLTSIVVTGTYMMFTSSSEVFHHQGLTAENQHNLRFAVEMLRRDVEHAGYNGTPNATSDPFVCPKPGFALPGLFIAPETIDFGDGRTIEFDQIFVVGDASLTGPLSVAALGNTSITLQPGSVSAAQFQASFSAPRVVRLVNPEGIAQFARVASLNAATLTINLDSSITQSVGGSCGYSPTEVSNHEVTPLTGYVYTLVEDAAEAGKTDLVRQRIDFDSSGIALVADTAVTMAEYVVDLEFLPLGMAATASPTEPAVAFETDTERASIAADTTPSAAVLTDTDIANRPQAARYLLYRISTRTRRAVPRRLFLPDAALNADTAEQMFFDLGDNSVAEVRTLQGRLELPNFVLRNLR